MHGIALNEADSARRATPPRLVQQLWFWPPPRPLVERFGDDFFRQVPTAPGVYFLCGPEAGVLYVGKARNLRRRLSSYRTADPERLPRRLVRLLHQVTRIEWAVCASEFAARHREELLICVLNPKFNRAGKVWPSPSAWRNWRPQTNRTAAVPAAARPSTETRSEVP